MNRTDIYRPGHQRTFADLYGVSPDTVDVSWTTSKTIVVQCAGKTFLHPILGDPGDDAPEFTCLDEDPVIVNLTDDERHQLELATLLSVRPSAEMRTTSVNGTISAVASSPTTGAPTKPPNTIKLSSIRAANGTPPVA